VLFLYCALAIIQGATWNAFAPVSDALNTAYGSSWDGAFIALLLNVSSAAFGIMLQPTSVAIDRHGTRAVTLFSSTMLAVSCLIRCTSLEGTGLRNIMMLSFVLNGFAGCWLNFGGPVLSENWFPQNERTLATSLGATSTYAGSAMGFIAGPLLVGSPGTAAKARAAVLSLHYLWAACASVVCALCWCHYPDRPDVPPSAAAAKKRREDAMAPVNRPTSWTQIFIGTTGLLFQATTSAERGKRLRFWIMALCLALPLGVYQVNKRRY